MKFSHPRNLIKFLLTSFQRTISFLILDCIMLDRDLSDGLQLVEYILILNWLFLYLLFFTWTANKFTMARFSFVFTDLISSFLIIVLVHENDFRLLLCLLLLFFLLQELLFRTLFINHWSLFMLLDLNFDKLLFVFLILIVLVFSIASFFSSLLGLVLYMSPFVVDFSSFMIELA